MNLYCGIYLVRVDRATTWLHEQRWCKLGALLYKWWCCLSFRQRQSADQ